MKASLRWIREYVDIALDDPDEIAAVMSRLGLEVEEIDLVQPGFSGVIVADVLDVRPHPNADRLRLVRVDQGSGEQEVVCGAWNFEAGAVVPLATVGAVLPGGLEVGAREIRGVPSEGMICSETELGIGEDAAGILVLGGDAPPPGTDFAAALPYPDVIFDLSITPNRPDLMGIVGIAREIGAYFSVPVRYPVPKLAPALPATAATVVIAAPERCHRFTAREVRDVTIGPSPLWMRLRLRDAGVRPINNVVDITNYVMLEFGQPVHVFDLDLLPDEAIVVRRASEGERLRTLDGVERVLGLEDLVIAGPVEPLGLAGIIGGGDSEVSASTTRTLIEVAHFSPEPILLSGKRHKIRTEAVARFERGVDPLLPPVASARAAELMVRHAGGSVAEGFIDDHPKPPEPHDVVLDLSEVERILGVVIPGDDIAGILTRLNFAVTGSDPLHVSVPTHRHYDVTRPADLIEEIARLYGYDNIPETMPTGAAGKLPIDVVRRRRIREALTGAGYSEIFTMAFSSPDEVDALALPVEDVRRSMLAVLNPLSEEQGYLRTSLLPGLLRGLEVNVARKGEGAALFEIGRVFFQSDDVLPDQPERLAFAASGRRPGRAWSADDPLRDVSDATGLWQALAGALGLEVTIEQAEAPAFHPGRCGRVLVAGHPIGHVGEIHPSVAEAFGLDERVAAGDLELAALLAASDIRQFRDLSPYPPVVFDLAFDLPGDAPAGHLLRIVEESAGPNLERYEIFDVFSGPPIGVGRKSIALRLTFRDPGRTLTDDELAPVRAGIASAVGSSLGGRLRGA